MCDIRLLKSDEIEVKVKQITQNGAIALLYKTARVDMQILDETFGVMNWETDYKEIKGNLYCGIGIRENEEKPFIWKWDCGIESREDDEGNQKKGEASDAFKRAGFKVGIGRELYSAPFIFLKVSVVEDKGKYKLADRFQTFFVKEIEYDEQRSIKRLVICDNKYNQVFSYGFGGRDAKENVEKDEENTEQDNKRKELIIAENTLCPMKDGTKVPLKLLSLFQLETILKSNNPEAEPLKKPITIILKHKAKEDA